VDCNGAACGAGCACGGGTKKELNCTDGMDNDTDGKSDCLDSDCVGAGTEICTDGVDNTCDKAVDCGDSKCVGNAACTNQNDGFGCTADNQCKGGKCLTEAATGLANGACSNAVTCSVSAQTGCNGGMCAETGTFDTCRMRCTGTGLAGTVGAGRCRPGYACIDTDTNTGNATSYCYPLCNTDADCSGSGANYGCNPWSKLCQLKDKGMPKYGAACTNGTQCESGICTLNYPGGMCFGLCTGNLKTCGTGGVCYYYASYGDNIGECYQGCTASAQCRGAPLTCQNKGQGNICVCGQVGEDCSANSQCCSNSCTGAFFPTCD
jgi:hypothetical protein